MSEVKFKKTKAFLFLIMFFLSMKNIKAENILFVDGINDLPLYTSMQNVNESLVVFDTNEGRIVKTEIVGKVKLDEVKNYYSIVLPNLGWIKKNDNQYIREKELLNIVFHQENKNILITFKIAPN